MAAASNTPPASFFESIKQAVGTSPSAARITEAMELVSKQVDRIGRDRATRVALRDMIKTAIKEASAPLDAKGGTYTLASHAAMQAALHTAMKALTRKAGAGLTKVTQGASQKAAANALREYNLHVLANPGVDGQISLDAAAAVWGSAANSGGGLIRQNQESVTKYGLATAREVEKGLAVSLLTNESQRSAMRRIREAIQGTKYRAEMVYRTEAMNAYNVAYMASTETLGEELGEDIWYRWTEHVDDVTGAPYDNRVDGDSIAMHGQVAPPGGTFTLPPYRGGSKNKRVGLTWTHPPNRPYDRARLIVWRRRWADETPGWVWENGARKYLDAPSESLPSVQ